MKIKESPVKIVDRPVFCPACAEKPLSLLLTDDVAFHGFCNRCHWSGEIRPFERTETRVSDVVEKAKLRHD